MIELPHVEGLVHNQPDPKESFSLKEIDID